MLSRFPVENYENLATELPVNYFTYTNDLPVSAQDICAKTLKDPVLSKVLYNMASNCRLCAAMKNAAPKVPFIPWPRTQKPWERVHIDFCELEGNIFLL